mmetsp:Transcript_43389/g.41835  ORF Transcript_43389/g.41835 Transcript_43389/m.41835 type:complete len:113 (+) Transcript_43389:2303-2641(+)
MGKADPTPITLISTRDSFAYDLRVKETVMNMGKGREAVIRKDFYFHPDNLPPNFRDIVGIQNREDPDDIENFRVGCHTYENFYSHEQMKELESYIEETEKKSFHNSYLPMTA